MGDDVFGPRLLITRGLVPAKLAVVLLGALGRCVGLSGLETAERRLGEARASGRLLLYYWIEDAVSLLTILSRCANLGSDVVYVCGDTYLGWATSRVLTRLNRRTLPFSQPGSGLRLRDIQNIVREVRPISISADGLGPFGRVNAGLGRLLMSRNAIAVPLSARPSRYWTLGEHGIIQVPIPGCRIAVAVGPLVAAGASNGEGPVQALEHALRAARAEALRLHGL
jgi:hypothetical protein